MLTPKCVRPAARASRLRLRPSTALLKGGGYPVDVSIGILSMSIFGMLNALDNRGRPHADADAQRDKRGFLVAPLQFIENGAKNHRASSTEWMTHRNGATIHVDLLVGNVERLHVAQNYRSKCLVEFPQVDVLFRHTGPFQDFFCHRDWARQHDRWFGAYVGELTDPGAGFQPRCLARGFAADKHCGSAVDNSG